MGSLVLNGSNAHATLNQALFPTVPFSAFMWVRLAADVTAADNMAVWSQTRNSTTGVQQISFEDIGGNGTLDAAVFTNGGGWVFAASSVAPKIDQWQPVGGTWQANNLRHIYVEGVKNSNNSLQTPAGLSRFTIGSRPRTTPGGWFRGKVAHAAFWNVVLTDQEHQQLASGADPSTIRPGNLTAYYPGTVINISGTNYLEDVSGNGYHLTLSGGWSFDGADTPPIDGGGPDPDEEAPNLTAPYFTPTGAGNTAEVGVTTDEGNGTLRAVMTGSATKPTAAQIAAGQDHTGATALRSLSGPITDTGTVSLDVIVPFGTGRYTHFCHTDLAGNASEVVTAGPFDTAYQEVFFDDFNRANSGNLGANWVNYYGSPAIVSGQARVGTKDGYDYSAAGVIPAAYGPLGGGFSVEVSTSAVIDPNDTDSVGVAFGVGQPGLFAGLLVFFAGDYTTLWWWDDISGTYNMLDSSDLTPEQALSRYRIDITHNGSATLHIYSLRDNALLMDTTVPGSSIPAYVDQFRPGIAFSEAYGAGTLWIDDFGIYAVAAPAPSAPPAPALFFGTNF